LPDFNFEGRESELLGVVEEFVARARQDLYVVVKKGLQIRIAESYLNAGLPRDTIRVLEDVRKGDPDRFANSDLLAWAYFKSGNALGALGVYREMTEREPSSLHAAVQLFKSTIHCGRLDEAASTLARIGSMPDAGDFPRFGELQLRYERALAENDIESCQTELLGELSGDPDNQIVKFWCAAALSHSLNRQNEVRELLAPLNEVARKGGLHNLLDMTLVQRMIARSEGTFPDSERASGDSADGRDTAPAPAP
jgi:hypothetical protein